MLTFGSLFAGIAGFDYGLHQAGMKCLWQVEIDPECHRVLSARFPDAALHEDVRQAGKHNLPAVGVITAGFPCQDLSVAGKRGGLSGERSGLFYEMTRIVNELQPALLVWENVPGLLSSNKGLDFLAVLNELDRIGYHGAWTGLDARWFGLAQRRRRLFGVFARGDIGAERCAEILSLRTRRQGHPPPGSEAGPRVAATIRSRSHRPGINPPGRGEDDDNLVTHALTDESCDASEDGTGRGTPIVAYDVRNNADTDGVALPVQAGGHGQAPNTGSLLFIDAYACRGSSSPNQHPVSGEGVSDALDTTGPGAVAFNWQSGGNKDFLGVREGHTDALSACQTPAVAFTQNQRNEVRELGEQSGALAAEPGMKQQTYLSTGMTVRRLTPTECARLQGFPDWWLDLDPPLSDSAKYRMLGNAVAVPVARWIGQRIVLVMESDAILPPPS